MRTDNERVINEIVQRLRWLVRATYQDAARISGQYGLTGAQGAVIRNLARFGPMSSAELSRRLYVTPATVTGIIDRLKKKGLVERHRQTKDRRVVLIALSETGEGIGQSLPDPIEIKLISGLAGMPTEEIETLAQSMKYLVELVGNDSDSPSDQSVDAPPEPDHVY